MEEQRLQHAGITSVQWITMLAFSKLAMFEEGVTAAPELSEDELLHLAKYTKKAVYSQQGSRLVCDWKVIGSGAVWDRAAELLMEELDFGYLWKSISYKHIAIFDVPTETPVSEDGIPTLEGLVDAWYRKHGKVVHKHELALHCGLVNSSPYMEIMQLLLDPNLTLKELTNIHELAEDRWTEMLEIPVAPLTRFPKKESRGYHIVGNNTYNTYELT